MDNLDVNISRATWYRGNGSSGSRLLIPEGDAYAGHMCCLGSVGLACGIPAADLSDKETPASLPKTFVDNWRGLVSIKTANRLPNNTDVCGDMMAVNDDYDIEDDEREDKLIKLGKLAGFNLTFVD